jgi:hypothetical protein
MQDSGEYRRMTAQGDRHGSPQAAPLIICGMHRSGTSLVTRALETAGLFVGHEKEHNHEAVFFQMLNQWMFEQLGAGWDSTYNLRFINDELAWYFHTVIGNVIGGPSATAFTGPDPRHRAVFGPDNTLPWGWKDPRNTFTAPVWERLFPGARLLHVCRNPLDVADSLRRREHEVLERHQAMLAGLEPGQLDGSIRFQQSPRLFHLEEGIALWEEYTRQALALETGFGARALRIRYEDFLADPVTWLGRIAAFAGLAPGAGQLEAAVSQVNPARRCAFTGRPELLSLYDRYRNTDIMQALGYDALLDNAGSSAA